MPLILADRVRDTTTTTGTGTVTLSGTAPTGYQNFSVIGNGNTTYYTINAGSQWEVGIGTYSSTGPTLARNTVLESSNANALVDFAAGTKDVFVTYPSDKSVNYDESNNVGIGTTSPSAILETSSSTDASIFASTYVGSGVGGSFIGRKARGSQSSPSGILSGDTLTSVLGRGYTSAGAFSGNVGAVAIVAAENFSSTANGTNITFATTATGATSRTERMRIDSAGSLGIGTSSPAERLTVNSASSEFAIQWSGPGNDWVLASAANRAYIRNKTAGVEALTILNAGNVGIGTSAPGSTLDVGGTIRTSAGGSDPGTGSVFYFVGSGAFQTVVAGAAFAVNTGANNARTERMRISIDGSTTLNVGGVSSTHQFLYNENGAEIQLSDATGNGPILIDNSGGLARFYKVGNGGMAVGTTGTGAFQFLTNNTERMRIDNAGLVGIGTSAPSARLDVRSGAGADNIIANRAGNAAYMVLQGTSFPNFNQVQSYDGSGNLYWAIGGTGTANTLAFSTNGSNERMRIDASGNLSLGTTVGTARLRVSAGGRIDAPVLGNVTNYPAFFSNNDPSYGLGIGTNGSTGHVWLQAQRSDSAVAYNITLNEAGGNVGIGTSAPQGLLHVVAGANNTLLFRGPINYATGGSIYAVNSANSAITPMEFGASSYFFAGGNVGIGTSSPSERLDTGTGNTRTQALVVSGDQHLIYSASATELGIRIGTGGPFFGIGTTGSSNMRINSASGGDMLFAIGGTERMRLNNSGQLLVGTSSGGRTVCINAADNWIRQVNPSRSWLIGCGTGTAYTIFDETAGTARFSIDTAGVWNGPNAIALGAGQNLDNRLEIGTGRTGSNFAYLDLIGDTTYTDYGLRLIRGNGGPNAISQLIHRGTGDMYITTQDAAPLYIQTNNATRAFFQSDGTMIMNGSLLVGRQTSGSNVNTNNDTGSFSVRGDGSNAASMSFHRIGVFAINMGLGTDAVFRIGGWSASSNCFQMDASGNLTMLGNVTAYSDARIKKDVETIGGALDLVSKMRGVRFTRTDNNTKGVGVIAQEMLEVLPEVVQQGVGDDDTLSVAYGNIVGVLIEAVKELTARVAELEGK